MKKNALTDSEVKTLLEARKILRRITRKYDRLVDKTCEYNLAETAAEVNFKREIKLERWLDELYDRAYVDFCEGAFIDIKPLDPPKAKKRRS